MALIRRVDTNNLKKSYRQSDWPLDINYIEITASMMTIDDHDFEGVEGGVYQNMIECIDFIGPVTEVIKTGTIWFNFNFPQKWTIEKDLYFYIYYTMDGNAVGKDVYIDSKAWFVKQGATPVFSSPTVSQTDVFTTSTTNLGIYAKEKMTNFYIPKTSVTSKEAVVSCSMRRRVDTDNYEGTFKLMKVIVRQL